jgi:hypothetical protein
MPREVSTPEALRIAARTRGDTASSKRRRSGVAGDSERFLGVETCGDVGTPEYGTLARLVGVEQAHHSLHRWSRQRACCWKASRSARGAFERPRNSSQPRENTFQNF